MAYVDHVSTPQAKPERARPTAGEIYGRVIADARDELERPPSGLGFSGLFAGATVGFSGLTVAVVRALLPETATAAFVATLFYPVGFVAVIIGRAQLFTENTLYPVALVLAERRHVLATVRLWVVVLAGNTLGAFLFALLVVKAGAAGDNAAHELAALGEEIHAGSFASNFWSAVMGGWLLALVAWLVEAAGAATGVVLVTSALTAVVGLGTFDHSVASTSEVFAALLAGSPAVSVASTAGWFGTAVLGNILGGVGIVALLNYRQVKG